MALTYEEAKKAGADAETITRKAIKRTGNIHGLGWKEKTGDISDLTNFDKVFFNDIGKATFEIETSSTIDDVYAEFHYCPLLAAWQKMGYDDETCAHLCDMAMDGDRGIAESMGYKLELTDTIAKGCATCKLHFHK
ncbi:L-2-amino-thiazoline-4-carboxylic acid hydrolase [Lachnospiraceae bacterium ASD3451]|uniref:L-2-amino-thiazoline-4-carboxylic acid hydrolase n=2 Tax=Diplocloster agilis TaxID=2850323 RepID=A0A949NEC0_9FIRM|nr:L-2-amino-thiazoline-4-carboxylic acid hydrolase [Diplocloster agilis]MBU9743825.1 L-2-amino-thiazoline-4-carboxylic acid hydrolase [Diplocloster agilis]